MSVFRVHKTDNYTTMSNHHLRNNNLTLKAKGLMSVMLSLPDDWDYSAKGLSALSLGGEDAVKSALKELEEQKYLKRTPIREKGIIRDWQYDIYENPENLENIESQPQGEKPLVVEPLVEKQSQINTKEINTKINNNNFTNVKLEQPTVTHEQPKRRIKLIDIVSDNRVNAIANNTGAVSKPDRKKNLFEKCAEYIDTYTQDNKLHSILIEYLKFRLAVKEKPIYLPQWRSMVNTLDDLTDDVTTKYKIVQQSLNGGNLKFFELKKYTRNYNNKKKFAEGDGLILGRNENEELSDEVF